MYSHFENEIKKYTAKHLLADIIIYIVMVVFGLAMVLAIADLIFPELVTETLAGVVMWVR